VALSLRENAADPATNGNAPADIMQVLEKNAPFGAREMVT
jgi:hypothetical protein